MGRMMDDRADELQGACVVELGSGTGYVSFVASALGAKKVVATEQASFRLPGVCKC